MVDITIFVEGGDVALSADSRVTANTEVLRRSLHRIFSDILGQEVGITVSMCGGNRLAVKNYLKSKEERTCLFTDLDGPEDSVEQFYQQMENAAGESHIIVPNERRSRIFFMIQQMEAWILSQPDAIELWAVSGQYSRRHAETRLADCKQLSGKRAEDIPHADKVLNDIISHFFFIVKNGVRKKAKYGKLKTAPALLNQLDVKSLCSSTSELQRFKSTFKPIDD